MCARWLTRSGNCSTTKAVARKWARTPGASRSKSIRWSCRRDAMPNSTRRLSDEEEPMEQTSSQYRTFAQPTLADLKRKSVVGGVAAVSAQSVRFVVQTATTMVLARLLSPEDFGLQGMVVVVTGFLGLFRDAGLGMATVQRLEVTHEQTSTLLWINVGVGVAL